MITPTIGFSLLSICSNRSPWVRVQATRILHDNVSGLLQQFQTEPQLDQPIGIINNTMMSQPEVVLDTNILVAGLRSRLGASFRLISLIGAGKFGINLSVPLVLEYEEVLTRQQQELGSTKSDVGDFLDYLCAVAHLHEVYFLWRPHLRDPKNEMVLELAVKAGCEYIVTYNKRDFRGVEKFGIKTVTAREFLQIIEELP